MCNMPPFFIPGLKFVDELAIWFTPDGQPLMIGGALARFSERACSDWHADNDDDDDDDDDLDPDVPF